MSNLALGIKIGATLASGFKSTFSAAHNEVKKLGNQVGALYKAQAERHANAGKMTMGDVAGFAATAFPAIKAVKDAMDFEHEMRLFGNVVDFNNQQLAKTKEDLVSIGKATNQKPGALLAGLNTLAAKGLDPDKSKANLNIIGKTATAYAANVNDIATTTFTMLDAMNIAEDQIPKALNVLAEQGKAGSFELRDMAKYFPMLTAQAKSLGMVGMSGIASLGSALQIAMKGASDPAEAANNFKNFLAKLTAPETVKKFKDMGVNIQAEMKAAMANGQDPVIAMINRINQMTGGDKFKIGELFGDMQVIDFLNPMLANLKEFERIKAKGLNAGDVIGKDFDNMMSTSQEQLNKTLGILGRIGDIFATQLLPTLNEGLTVIAEIGEGFSKWIEASPVISKSIGILALGLAGYATYVGAAAAAQWVWNAALTANPIGLIVAGVAAFGALAYTVYKNWEPIMEWFREKFAWLGKAVDWVKGVGGGLGGTGAGSAGGIGSTGAGTGAANTPTRAGFMGPVPAKPLPTMNLAGAATAPQVSNVTNAPINVYQQPGENGQDLAKRVSAELTRAQAADKRRQLHD